MMKLDTTLYLVTDSTYHDEKSFLYTIEEACKGGITLLQLREKERSTREYLILAQKVKRLCDTYHIPLIIDDRADIALTIDAAGVHVGQSDLPVKEARRMLGSERIVGATAKTVNQAREAYEDGADYLGVGAIYPTTTKVITILTPVNTLEAICRSVPIPVVAIGGLNAENMDILSSSSIKGMAVVSAIMKSKQPRKDTQILKEKVLQIIN
ncbi:MAG TPA: thiamine phosphate synthase [Lachnospiraceae bacterium]|nr:thiamine phosphate synthase [Lachnospiraceae bacterium]